MRRTDALLAVFGTVFAVLALLALGGSSEARGPTLEGMHAPPSTRTEQDFVAANELALKGGLAGAITLYTTLLDQGVVHEDLFFNLGNAYAQSGKTVDAIISYERALRLAPRDPDTRANLELLRSRIAASEKKSADGGVEDVGEVALADVIEPLVAPLPVEGFAWLTIGANALLFLSIYLRRRSISTRGRRLLAVSFAVAMSALVLGGSAVTGHLLVARDPRAVVTKDAEMKEGPHARFKASGRVPAGVRVRVLGEDASWIKILRQDGTTGWIPAQSITRV